MFTRPDRSLRPESCQISSRAIPAQAPEPHRDATGPAEPGAGQDGTGTTVDDSFWIIASFSQMS